MRTERLVRCEFPALGLGVCVTQRGGVTALVRGPEGSGRAAEGEERGVGVDKLVIREEEVGLGADGGGEHKGLGVG